MADNSARIAQIKSKLAVRTGKPGYKRNVVALQSELQKLSLAQAATLAKPAIAPVNPGETKAP